jgi:hypothetical protein
MTPMTPETPQGHLTVPPSPRRVWPWVVLALVVLVPGCVVAIMAGMKHSDAYTFSLNEIRRNPEVRTVLGEPLETGLFVTGEININNADGNANIQYTVRGPKGTGEAFVRATRQYSQWALDEVVVDVPDAKARIAVVGTVRAPQ